MNDGFFLPRNVPLAIIMHKRELLPRAYPFFITPESNIVKMAIGLMAETGKTKEGPIFTH
ncbi:hypothetical protein D3C78_1124020 [compost metagenome]